MDKLSLLFDVKQFAAVFGEATDDSNDARGEPDAVMWMTGGVGVAGVGLASGHGQMSFQGANHHFDVCGLAVVDVTAASIYATGRVKKLKRIADFSGDYRASSGGKATAGGGLATCLQNEHGVVIQLVAMDASTATHRSVNGLRMGLKDA